MLKGKLFKPLAIAMLFVFVFEKIKVLIRGDSNKNVHKPKGDNISASSGFPIDVCNRIARGLGPRI